jgi:hypothetical protein
MGTGVIQMKGFITIAGGKPVMYEGATAIIYEQTPEEEALMRWKQRQFLELEREIAVQWRQQVESIDLKAMAALFKEIHQTAGRPTKLEDIKALADTIIDGPDQEAVLRMGLVFTISDENWMNQIIARWQNLGRPKIRDYAPYFTHVVTVDLFFCLGMAASQIGSERKSNKVDIEYLYYLPFCMVFTSRDDLHVRSAPLFLRADQSFIHGDDLKADLKRLDEYYDALPEETKKQSIYSFAAYPPDDDSFLVTRLWKKHMRPPDGYVPKPSKFEGKTIYVPPAGSDPKEIMKALDDFEANAVPMDPGTQIDMDNAAAVQFRKFTLKTKGKWTRIPETA